MPHTEDTYMEMVRDVEDAVGTVALKEVERRCGLKYNPQAMLWDRVLRRYVTYPDCCFYDWCHSLVASTVPVE